MSLLKTQVISSKKIPIGYDESRGLEPDGCPQNSQEIDLWKLSDRKYCAVDSYRFDSKVQSNLLGGEFQAYLESLEYYLQADNKIFSDRRMVDFISYLWGFYRWNHYLYLIFTYVPLAALWLQTF
jgi:hypothetical protein